MVQLTSTSLWASLAVIACILAGPAHTANIPKRSYEYNSDDPFAVLDPQNWVNPANMTWQDWRAPPGTNWADPTKHGSIRDFKIALITVDYSDKPFVITLPVHSTVFSNPQPIAATLNLTRKDVPQYYHDFLNTPNEVNRGHTLHEYWSMLCSFTKSLMLQPLMLNFCSERLHGPFRRRLKCLWRLRNA